MRVQFTVEYENKDKELNYLEIKTINNKQGNYDFKVYRKDAITNIQIKPESCHDDKVKRGVFKGFILRAKNIYYRKDNPDITDLHFWVTTASDCYRNLLSRTRRSMRHIKNTTNYETTLNNVVITRE